jgi:hypothetical protein
MRLNMKKDPLAPIIGKDTTTRGNPIAVAARKRYATSNGAGFHETDKYERREKHKKRDYDSPLSKSSNKPANH